MRTLRNRTSRAGPESGQTMAEYALVLAVICVGVLAAVTTLSGGILSGINNAAGLIAGLV